MIDIMDSKGRVRPAASFTDEELALLDDDKREAFMRFHLSVAESEQAEADLKAAHDHVAACVAAERAAEAEVNRLRPKRSFLDEWKQMKEQGRAR